MKSYSNILFLILLLVLIFWFVLCRFDYDENYELSELAFDVCQKHCYNQGYDHDICSDKDKLKDCISRLEKISSKPPPGTSLAPVE